MTAVLLVGLLAYAVWCFVALLTEPHPGVDAGSLGNPSGRIADLTLGSAVELAALAVVVARARAGGAESRSWTLLAAGWGAYCASEIAFDVAEAVLGRGVRGVTGLETGYLVGYLLLFTAMVRLLWVGASRWSLGYVAEAVGIALLAAALAQEFLVRPLIDLSGQPAAAVTSWVMLPVADLLLLLGSLVVWGRARGRWWLLPLAFAGITAADVTFAVISLTGNYAPGTGLDVFAVGAVVTTALAALHVRSAAGERRRTRFSIVITPAVVLPGSFALLVVDHVHPLTGAAVWLSVVAAVAAFVRLVGSQSELLELATLRREVFTDDLTGVANRRALLAELDRRCAAEVPFALAIVDLDRFKEVNDGLGHAAGDELLRQVVAQLVAVAPPTALVARLGGDELAVLLPGPDRDEAMAEALHAHSCMVRSYDLLGHRVHVGASVGVATFPDDAARTSELLRCADIAMYEAKTLGGSVCLFHGDDRGNPGSLARMTQLRAALGLRDVDDVPTVDRATAGDLVVVYQPQVRTSDGAVVGVEALVRWAHPDLGLVPPTAFIDEAERHGLMGHLTHRVLDEALSVAASWDDGGKPLRLSVNLSATNLLDTDLPSRVATLLVDHGVRADRLELEITESVLVSSSPRTRAVLDGLHALGVPLAIDDFGTGYSSLAYLKELAVAEVKLDRSFVADIAVDERSAAIVSSTIWLGHRLGVRIVAEGVEDETTLELLGRMGCDVTQGFLHSPGLTAPQLTGWLRSRRAPAASRT